MHTGENFLVNCQKIDFCGKYFCKLHELSSLNLLNMTSNMSDQYNLHMYIGYMDSKAIMYAYKRFHRLLLAHSAFTVRGRQHPPSLVSCYVRRYTMLSWFRETTLEDINTGHLALVERNLYSISNLAQPQLVEKRSWSEQCVIVRGQFCGFLKDKILQMGNEM